MLLLGEYSASQLTRVKGVLASVASSRMKYENHLKEEAKKVLTEQKEKFKQLTYEIDELKKKKKMIVQEAALSLAKSADELALEAEKTNRVKPMRDLLCKSNSFRKSAQEKETAFKSIDMELNAKLVQLKND